MKKCKYILGIIFCICILVSGRWILYVEALESKEEEVGGESVTAVSEVSNQDYVVSSGISGSFFTIDKVCVVENICIQVEAKITGAIFKVGSGARCIFRNIKIEGNGECGRIVQVENGGICVIDGIEVASTISCSYAIRNRGGLTIKSFTQKGESSVADLDNQSDDVVIERTSLRSILLGSGYITVNENTEVASEIKLILLGNTKADGKCIVKGDGIYASYFIDKFSLNEQGFGLEYVGALDSVSEAKRKDIEKGLKGLRTGDIFLTSEAKNVVAGAYATGAKYLKENGGTFVYESSIYAERQVLDNYQMASVSNLNKASGSRSDESVKLRVSQGESSQEYTMGKGGMWLVFIDGVEDGEQLNYSSNLTVRSIYKSKSHSAVVVLHNGEGLSGEMWIGVMDNDEPIEPEESMPVPEPTPVELICTNTSFEYNGIDHFSSIEVKYVYGGETCFLDLQDTEIKNVGKYSIPVIFSDSSSNYGLVELDRDSVEIEVTKRSIEPRLETSEFIYTGSTPKLKVLFTGLIGEDEVKYNLIQDKGTNVLESGYVAKVELDNKDKLTSNYTIEQGEELLGYKITKATIDESKISFEDISKVYDTTPIALKNGNILDNLIYVEYVTEEKEIVNSGTYIVSIHLVLLDKINYHELDKTTYQISITIDKREIVPTLKKSEFNFNNSTPNLEIIFKNAPKESIKYLVTMDKDIFAGEHDAEVILDTKDTNTSNYFISSKNSRLSYKITPALVDTSKASFNDQIIHYGEKIDIKVSNLPEGIRVNYLNVPQEFVVGEYEIIAKFELEDSSNYRLDRASLSMRLTVTAKEVDISNLRLSSKKYVYDGIAHSLDESELVLDGLKATVLGETKYTEVGEYEIAYNLSPSNNNYKLVGKEDLRVSGILKITPADYDISSISFKDRSVVFNNQPHTIEYTGTLPYGLSTLETLQYTDAGSYNIYLEFKNMNPNYFTPASMSATLNITKKEIFVTLKETAFVYTGNKVELEYNVSGVVDGDDVKVELEYVTSIDAKDYVAKITSLSSPNYFTTTNSLYYHISKAPSDISNIRFPSVKFTYTGNVYEPRIHGTMPSYLTYEIYCERKIKNVGVYDVYTKFSADENHVAPEDLHATITVDKKEVQVEFSKYLDLKYNGEIQYIGITVKGMVDKEDVDILYSDTPLEAGNYSCRVSLKANTNYVITGDDTCIFNIYLEKKIRQSKDYTVSIEGGLFETASDLSVHSLSLSKTNKETLLNTCENLETYECFEICSETEKNDVKYELSLNSINLSKGKYTLYHLSETGKLTKLDHQITGNSISFKAPTNSTFILAKEKEPSALPIYLILISILLTLSLLTSLALVFKSRRIRSRGETGTTLNNIGSN